MEIKEVAFELEANTDTGVIEGYGSVFSVVDDGNEIVMPGAFTKTLARQKVRMLWQHSMDKPIGVWDEIREDTKGLYVKGRILPEVQLGREAIALFKAGAMDSLSIGYRTVDWDKEGGVRKLNEVDLYEISAVTIPMNSHATASVKAVEWTNKREVEAALRDVLGLSQSEAKAFLADGFAGLTGKRDVAPVEADAEVLNLFNQIRLLKENFHV